ncbi:hypothetical protein COLO4_09612 [Corchorus olitorius]|uniref:F-box domain-containing protein n=1 Tax=Corchorus olitorius TaxID=93759 RepID=A0A1R3KBK6_9ROSI|nr:hypothetical protein COLO4_09612 [Corchorus olitorius]
MDSSSKSKILKQQHDDFGDPGDRISELPIEILLHILSYLPTMKKIVSTSALSRKWKSLWTLSPTFNLNYDSGEGEELHHISLDSVQKDLELIPKSASIGTFRLRFSMLSHASNTRISIPTLQRLSVCFNDTKHIFLRIHSPNLRSFKLSCSPFKIELCHLPSLAEADLDIKPCGNQQQILHHARGTRELIDRICHVKSLKLSHSTLQSPLLKSSSKRNENVDRTGPKQAQRL